MHHIGTITKSSNKSLPFHAQCSCGPAGDFSAKESGIAYLQSHFAKLAGISTFELVDNSDKPQSAPVLPNTHIGGIGTMPATHATQPASAAPPPPPPPASKVDE